MRPRRRRTPRVDAARAAMRERRYRDAAGWLTNAANEAEGAGDPVEASALAAEAAQALSMDGDAPTALGWAKKALSLAAGGALAAGTAAALTGVVSTLRGGGHVAEATELESAIGAAPPPVAAPDVAPAVAAPSAALPSHCPACAAPVDPAQVEWHDNGQGACPYCDTLLT